MEKILKNYSLMTFLVFAVFAWIVLTFVYGEAMWTASERSLFLCTGDFFAEMMRKPFGFADYIGSFLTQYLSKPWLGALLFLAIWGDIYSVTRKVLSLPKYVEWLCFLPVVALFISVTDLGYWVYCLPSRGYMFAHSLAFLAAMLLVRIGMLPFKKSSCVGFDLLLLCAWFVAVPLVAFPLIGCYAIMAELVFALVMWRRLGIKIILPLIIGAATTALWPWFLQNHVYTSVHIENIYDAGFPVFTKGDIFAKRPMMPFTILLDGIVVLALIAGFLGKKKKKNTVTLLYFALSVVAAGIACGAAWMGVYKNYALLAEMRMLKATEEQNWEEVMNEAGKSHYPTHAMVMMKNVALLNLGQIGEKAYEYPNSGISINCDSLQIDERHTVLPVIYYNFGLANFAIKNATENAIDTGFNVHELKLLARAAHVTGEVELENKYKTLLGQTTLYAGWNDTEPSDIVKTLYSEKRDNYLGGDAENYERFLVQHFCQHRTSCSEPMQELMMLYAMIAKQPAYFWRAFDVYIDTHNGKPLPKHYQEACQVFFQYMPSTLRNKVQIDKQIEEDFFEFRNTMMTNTQYQKTYWWYFYHGRNV